MHNISYAKLFMNGGSQAVRLPQEYRFEGDRVRIRRVGRSVILEPITFDVHRWFVELDRFKEEPFLVEEREQPLTPDRDILS
jgi:antitoxin VapB